MTAPAPSAVAPPGARVAGVLLALRGRPWARPVLLAIPIFALFLTFVVTGFRGVDFGDQWDEKKWHIDTARDMVASGILLPRAYIYPSFTKWMVLLPSLPPGLGARENPRAMQAAMKAAFANPGYLLTVRRIFIFVSGLTLVWIYGAALALRRPWWEATLGAAAMAFSWEFAYHARFVANDTILAQFAALTVFLLALYQRTRRSGWLYGAAVAVGLATGTKYPGVVLLVPVLAASALTLPPRAWWPQLRRAAGLCAVSFGAYVASTPGTVLDPFVFIEQTRKISTLYQNGFYGYSVASAWEHTRLVVTFFAVSFFSAYKLLALLLFVATIAGAVVWVRADRRTAGLLLCFPLLYLVFFCGTYRVMIIRNYLLVTPFFALFAARGIAALHDRLPPRWPRWALVGALAVALIVQGAWLTTAAESIRHPDLKADARHALAYVAAHPSLRFRLSPRVRALAAEQGLPLPANVTDGMDGTRVVFLGRAEAPHPFHMKTNDPWFTEAVFGPREMNFNWYTTWDSRDRVVVMTLDKARATGIPLALGK